MRRPFLGAFIGALFGVLLILGYIGVENSHADLKAVSPGVNGGGVVTAGELLLPDGSCGSTPGLGFNSEAGLGLYRIGTAQMGFCTSGAPQAALTNGAFYANILGLDVSNQDVKLARDAANTPAFVNGTNAQTLRIYGTTTGPKYLSLTASASNATVNAQAGDLLLQAGGNTRIQIVNGTALTQISGSGLLLSTGATANQLRTAQTTAPTCTTNCGTSPSCTGTDTAMKCTMGASGVPASPITITFNGTWAAAPSCTAASALSSMVVGKLPISIQTTTTTAVITTNGTAPATSDAYYVQCIGLS